MTLQTSYSEPHSFNSTGSYRKRQSERQLHQLIFQAFVAPVIAVGLTFLMLAFGAGMFATITYCAFMISSQLTDSIVYITAASAIASTLFSLITPKISSKRLSLLMLITLTFVSNRCP
ncbi:hypothetical protein M3Y95_00670100 [Aphelenchoides besseyi]|nr:hypothetical protein M3Y95_00670100 [Aphelenchoides besseyi]